MVFHQRALKILHQLPWLVTLLLVVILWFTWVFSSKPTPVLSVRVQHQKAVKLLRAVGEVQSTPIATVCPPTTAKLVDLQVQPGDRIVANQVIGTLETTESWALQREVKAGWQVAKAEVKDALTGSTALLMLRDTVHQAKQAAQTKLNQAKHSLKEAEQLLQHQDLKSPVGGIVARRVQEPGDIASPRQPILTLIDPEQLDVIAQIKRSHHALVFVGQRARVSLDNKPQQTLGARVIRIAKPEPDSETFPVTLRLEPSEFKILPGMRVTVDLETEIFPQALVLPISAIETEPPTVEGEVSVYLIDHHRIHRQWVKVSALSTDQVQILSGLKPGDWVVTDAQKPLPLTSAVQPVNNLINP